MIAIIIVGFNSRPFLPSCLKSIQSSDYKKYKIIFVDNKSADDSIDYIKHNYPATITIQNEANFGFAKANNIGIMKAKALGARYVMILNPDTLIDSRCLSSLADKASDNIILQPLILLYDGRKTSLINTSGNVLHILGFSYCGDYRQNLDSCPATEKSVALASGAAAFIPMAILDKVGLFDDAFFLYHEDADLFWRCRMLGYDIILEPKAKAWHKYSFSRTPDKMYYAERNRLAFITKNFQCRTIILLIPVFLITELAILIYALKEGWLTKKISSYFGYIKMLPLLWRERQTIQKNRKKSDRQLLIRYGSLALGFSEVSVPFLDFFNKLISAYWHAVRKIL